MEIEPGAGDGGVLSGCREAGDVPGVVQSLHETLRTLGDAERVCGDAKDALCVPDLRVRATHVEDDSDDGADRARPLCGKSRLRDALAQRTQERIHDGEDERALDLGPRVKVLAVPREHRIAKKARLDELRARDADVLVRGADRAAPQQRQSDGRVLIEGPGKERTDLCLGRLVVARGWRTDYLPEPLRGLRCNRVRVAGSLARTPRRGAGHRRCENRPKREHLEGAPHRCDLAS
jgi:hypothetical protein